MYVTFSRDQYISLHHLNANLRDVFWSTDKGDFWPSFHSRKRTVYKEFQSTTSSDQEQEGIGEKSNFFQEKKGWNAHK